MYGLSIPVEVPTSAHKPQSQLASHEEVREARLEHSIEQ
jgi:hypothetical protein